MGISGRVHAVSPGDIVTIAGGGVGDNNPATSTSLFSPVGVTLDSAGNLYIADRTTNRIRKVAVGSGIITTVAGNGIGAFAGDGGAATAASLKSPAGLAVDSEGNLFIADTSNNRIRKVAFDTGIITTVAGNGIATFGGDGGAATSASLSSPSGVTLDSAGNLYIADLNHSRIRKVASDTGIITTVAGNGIGTFAGDGGAATEASLFAFTVALDSDGNLYIADSNNYRIRKVAASTGIITTVAGNGTQGFAGDGGAATSASLYKPSGLAVDNAGNLYIADSTTNRIRKVAAGSGIITTVAGNDSGTFAGDGGAATSASLYNPSEITLDSDGNLYIADTGNHNIRKVMASTGIITSVAGNGTVSFAGDGGVATSSSLYLPSELTVDSAGNLYVADEGNHRIRKVAAGSGIITTVAGNGTQGFGGDGGAATSASLSYPSGVTLDSAGNLYIADMYNNRIRKVAAGSGIITTVAGNGTQGLAGDGGAATAASLVYPSGVTVDSVGNLYIVDQGHARIRKVAFDTGIITTVAGNGSGTFAGDGGAATSASLSAPYRVFVDSDGNLYIADSRNRRIRKVTASTGVITTVAGNGIATFGGDGGVATSASLLTPYGVTLDSSGNLYVADTGNKRIRKIAAGTGIITTVAGNGIGTFAGDGGAATSASLNNPFGVTLDSAGNLYIADRDNNRIRKVIKPDATSAAISYSPAGPYKAGDLVTITATFNDKVADTPAPQIALNVANTLAAVTMTKVDSTHYNYVHTVGEGSGVVTVSFPTGVDINGVPLSSTPSSGATFTVLPTTYPAAAISYGSAGPYKLGDTVTITADFSEPIADGPLMRIAISSITGGSALPATNMTKVTSTRYTYNYVVGSGNGTANISLSTGTNIAGNAVIQTPTSGGSFTVVKTPATVVLGGLTTTYDGNPKSVTVTSTPVGLTATITYEGSSIPPAAAGNYAVIATINDASYQGTSNGTLTIAKAPQVISFAAIPVKNYGDAPFGLGATTTSGLVVGFTSATPAVCSVSGSIVTSIAAGTCTIAADQAGNANYNAASQVTQSITIGKGSQTVSFGTAPPIVVGGTGTVSAAATSGLAVGFTSTTPAVCSVSGSTVTGIAAGTCIIAADQAGNANYNAASQVTQSITVGKGSQTVSFGTAPPIAVGGTGTVSAAATSGLAVNFTSNTPSVCSVSGSTVTGIAAGTCTIAADQAGNANYNAASQETQSITVGKASQTVSFGTAPAIAVGGTGTVSAAATSGLAVGFTSATPAVCSVSGSTVTGIAVGTCTIAADQAGNTNYNAAGQMTQSITVGKGSQTLSFGTAPAIAVGGTGTVSAAATSGLAVGFTSATPAVCSVSGSTVTGIAAGTCIIAADQAGNANYNAASQVTQSITVGKGSQTLSFGTAPAIAVGGTGAVSATATSGLAVGFTSATPAVCSVSGSTVTGIAVGTCTIAADQAGNANYNAAGQVTQSITVGKGSQTVSFGTAPAIAVGGTGTVSAAATSGLAVSFSTVTPAVCTVSGNTVTGIAAGVCSIAASQAGNVTYNAAPQVTQAITIKSNQTVSFGTAPNIVVGGTSTISATASSGLAVIFTSATPGVCTVSGNTVTGIALGTCTIAANQAGSTNYNAAAQVTQSIPITVAPTLYSLTTNIAGSGSINNLHQNSPAFACSSPSETCSVTAAAGTFFTLYATPSMLFDFAGWSGGGCSSDACQVTLDGNTTVAAIFTPQPLLQCVGNSNSYMSFSAAYGDASNGSEIRSRDAKINGDVHLNRAMSVTLNGGYAEGFTAISGFTTIQGTLFIEKGSVIVDNIIVALTAVPDFTLAATSTATVVQGGSTTATISAAGIYGFNSGVTLTATGLPAGALFSFNPATIAAPGSGNSTLTLTAGAATPIGTYPVTVTGMGGDQNHTATISFTVTASPDFTLAASSTVTAVQGGSNTAAISTTGINGFSSGVALTATGFPAGATASFNPTTIAAPGSGNSTLTLTAGALTPTGTYTVTVTGTGGGKTHTATISFAVVSGGSATLFSDGFESEGWSTAQVSGTEGSWTMAGAGTNPVAQPHGGAMLADFNAYEATSGSQTRLYRSSGIAIPGTITSATLSFWMYHDTGWGALNDQVQVQVSTNGTSWTNLGTPVNRYDGTTGWAQVSIDLSGYKGQILWLGFVGISAYGMDIYLDDVTIIGQGAASADFTITGPDTTTVSQGDSGTATISTTVVGGFNAAVALTASGVPTGATATFNPTSIAAPGSGSATLTLTAGALTPTGTYSLTITGTGNGKTHAAIISFTVTTPCFSGTVATGAPVQDAEVSLRTLDGEIVSTISDAMGGWLVPFSSFKKALTPPFVVKARFTVAGRVVNLFSMSTDDAGGNIKMNITPVTDMITRAYEPLYSTNPDTVEGLPNDPGKLAQIIGGARIVLGELLPPAIRSNADFIRDPFVPDPLKSDIDALLERTKIGYQNGNVTVADVTGKPMATTSFAKLSSNTVGTGDAETVTKAEADEAIAKRGAFPETTPPYVNEAANGNIPPVPAVPLPAPANFTATKTGDFTWKLTWSPVAGAVQYFVYQKKGSEPSVAAGIYDQSSTNQPFIGTGGNSTSAHYQVDTEGTYYWVLAAVGTDGTENEKGLPTSFVGIPTAAASHTFGSATTGVISYISVYSDIDGTGYMGRGELAVGQSVQLKARAWYSDRTFKEIGPLVTWQWEKYVPLPPPLPGAKLTLSASGVLTAISSGYAWFGREVYAVYIENGITYYDSYIFYEP